MSEDATTSQSQSYPLNVQAGRRYLLCQCGRSHKKPLCDGAHAGSGKLPCFYTAPATAPVKVCCCYRTSTRPLCDGSCASAIEDDLGPGLPAQAK